MDDLMEKEAPKHHNSQQLYYVQSRPWVHATSLSIGEAARYISNRSVQLANYVCSKIEEVKEGKDISAYRQINDWSTVKERFATLSWYECELVSPEDLELQADQTATAFLNEYEARSQLLVKLKTEAAEGDEDAAYHLAAQFCPPPFKERNACYACSGRFGVTRYRHHCRHCGESFCHLDSRWQRKIPHFGWEVPVRVCRACCSLLSREARADRVAWRLMRVIAFVQKKLKPYFEKRVDNHVDRAARIMEGAIYIAKVSPLSMSASLAVETLDLLRRYGLVGVAGVLLRQEFVKAVELLCKVSGVDQKFPMSIQEISVAMYYQLAHSRGWRGNNPDWEAKLHEKYQHVNVTTVKELLFYAPLSLFFMYDKDPVDMQLLAGQQGWQILFAALESAPEQPAFALFAHSQKNVAVLVIRGTHTIQDVVTDIRAKPIPFSERPDTSRLGGMPKVDRHGREIGGDWGLGEEELEGDRTLFERTYGEVESQAMCGIARAAEWLFSEVHHSLVGLHQAGTQIILMGHSLGAAVASMTAELLIEDIPDIKCISFATPACATRSLAQKAQAHTTSIVLHDDVIPRITPTSVRYLLQDLLYDKERFEKDLRADFGAVYRRARTIWAPQHRSEPRGRATLLDDNKDELIDPASYKKRLFLISSLFSEDGQTSENVRQTTTPQQGYISEIVSQFYAYKKRLFLRSISVTPACTDQPPSDEEDTHYSPQGKKKKITEDDHTYMSPFINSAVFPTCGINNTSCQFEYELSQGSAPPDSSCLNLTLACDAEQNDEEMVHARPVLMNIDLHAESAYQSHLGYESPTPYEKLKNASTLPLPCQRDDFQKDTCEEDPNILADEMVLPELFIPGNIIHIYSQRGLYKACYVPQTFPDLRRISMVGNMVEDHGSGSYYAALCEVRSVLEAEEQPPEWVPFDRAENCQTCEAPFTWHSTLSSEAQKNRDKHNCKRCGSLVCDPCSRNKKVISKYGLNIPVRVCDKCFFSCEM